MADIELRVQDDNSTYIIDRFNGLKNLQSSSQSTTNSRGINYGTLANTGNTEIVDIYGEIYNKIEKGSIENSNLAVELYINNNKIQEHITTDSDYTSDGNFSIQMTNNLSKLENLIFNGRFLSTNTTAYTLISEILTQLGLSSQISSILSSSVTKNGNTSVSMASFLSSTIIPYAYLKESTYREVLDKFCEITQTNLIEDSNGNYKFVSARPIIFSEDTPIVIPYTYQYSPFEYDIIVKNKISSVFVPEKTIEESWKTLTSKQITHYKYQYYTSSYSDYTNILNSKAYNQDIEVLGNHILKENTTTWFYSLIKFNLQKNAEVVPHTYSYKSNAGVTYWINSQGESLINAFDNDKDVLVFSNDKEDDYIIDDWVNFTGNVISSVKYLAPNFDIRIRENNDNTLTIFAIMLTDITNDDVVSGLYNIYNIIITYKSYTENIMQDNTLTYNIKLPENELIQSGAIYNNQSLAEYISSNITNEYFDGVRVGTITLACTNFYDENDNLIIDFDNGEIVKVGYVLKIEGNNSLWRVITSTFRYSNGAPYVDLTVREIIQIYQLNFNVDGGETINGVRVVYGKPIGTLPTITKFGYEFGGWQIDGEDITEDTIWTWNSDKTAEAQWNEVPHTLIEVDTNGNIINTALNIYKTNSDETFVYINNNLVATSTTEGSNSVGISLPIDDNEIYTIKITGGDFYFNQYVFSSSYNMYITSVKMGTNCVSRIGNDAFRDCTNLSSVVIQSTISSIGVRAFESCTSLVTINISNNIQYIYSSAFNNCASLADITLPTSLINIGSYAFHSCKSLKNIIIPDGTISIGNHAFDNCTNLSSITLPNSLQTLGNLAFTQCESLESVIIPLGVTDIGTSIFAFCTNLIDVKIYPKSSTTKASDVNNGWFMGCPNNLVIHIPSSVSNPTTAYGQYWNYNYSGSYYYLYQQDFDWNNV